MSEVAQPPNPLISGTTSGICFLSLYEFTATSKSVMYNIKLVNSLQKNFQRVLSHGSQSGGKKRWFLSMTSLKGSYQFYHARTFSRLQRHGCSNQSNLEMAAEFLMKNVSYLNLNISRTKNGRNKQ